MKPRERRMAAAFVAGRSQAEIAREEHLSQSAVSQLLQRSGATALVLGLSVLDGDDRAPSEGEPAPRR
jgi:DNA-binding CsgD family transcriptional regulator